MAYNFKTGKKYNFSCWGSEILGTNYKSVEVEGVVGYSVAKRYMDLDGWHAQMYPTLPEGTPDRPQDFEYLLLKTPMVGGDSKAPSAPTVIAIPWIKEDSIVLVEGIDFNVKVRGKSIEDIDRVRLMFAQNNIQDFEIEIVNRETSRAV